MQCGTDATYLRSKIGHFHSSESIFEAKWWFTQLTKDLNNNTLITLVTKIQNYPHLQTSQTKCIHQIPFANFDPKQYLKNMGQKQTFLKIFLSFFIVIFHISSAQNNLSKYDIVQLHNNIYYSKRHIIFIPMFIENKAVGISWNNRPVSLNPCDKYSTLFLFLLVKIYSLWRNKIS